MIAGSWEDCASWAGPPVGPVTSIGSVAADPTASAEVFGARIGAQETHLRLVLAHLAGSAVRARVEPDDLLQEVYLRAWSARTELPADEPGLRRFLGRLARNVVVDVARAIRAAKRDAAVGPLDPASWSRAGHEPAAQGAGPATLAGLGETTRSLVRAFEALPPDHRRVLGLRQFQGLSARDTASRMGRSETAVHSLYRRALLAWTEAGGISAGSGDESGAAPRPLAP